MQGYAGNRRLIGKVDLAVMLDFAVIKQTLPLDVSVFIRDWLINRIHGTDRKYTTVFFNSKGLVFNSRR